MIIEIFGMPKGLAVASWPKSKKSKRSEKPKRFNSGAPWAHNRGIQRKSQGVHPKSGMMLWEFIQHIEIMDDHVTNPKPLTSIPFEDVFYMWFPNSSTLGMVLNLVYRMKWM